MKKTTARPNSIPKPMPKRKTYGTDKNNQPKTNLPFGVGWSDFDGGWVEIVPPKIKGSVRWDTSTGTWIPS